MQRCETIEILDAIDLPDRVVAQSYRELRTIHFWLGNTRAILRLLKNAVRTETNDETVGEPVRRVLDIGCGHGALLMEIREQPGLEVVGIDVRPAPAGTRVPIVTGNAVTDRLPTSDVVICVMVAHHLSETELTTLIENVARSCRRFIMLDLVRHPIPLALFRAFVAPFLSPVNAQDGQTSIRRAFTAAEMRGIVARALAQVDKPVRRVRHTVSPLWIRQVVDIAWERG
jgi:2-polyprenyl-3-methyl-5-hydroxy-6-metoxy-1,4-benzoquinol methylase